MVFFFNGLHAPAVSIAGDGHGTRIGCSRGKAENGALDAFGSATMGGRAKMVVAVGVVEGGEGAATDGERGDFSNLAIRSMLTHPQQIIQGHQTGTLR